MSDPHPLTQAIIAGKRKEVPELVQQCLDAGESAAEIVEKVVQLDRKALDEGYLEGR